MSDQNPHQNPGYPPPGQGQPQPQPGQQPGWEQQPGQQPGWEQQPGQQPGWGQQPGGQQPGWEQQQQYGQQPNYGQPPNYAAPQQGYGQPPAAYGQQPAYGPAPSAPRGLAIASQIFFGIGALSSLVAAIGMFRRASFLRSKGQDEYTTFELASQISFSDLDTLDSIDGNVAIGLALAALSLLVGGILFIIWFFKSYSALHQTGQARFSPGLSIAAWLIPLANVFFAPVMSTELWSKLRRSAPILPIVWAVAWGAYVLFGMISFIQRGGVDYSAPADTMLAFAFLALAAAGGLGLVYITMINKAQS